MLQTGKLYTSDWNKQRYQFYNYLLYCQTSFGYIYVLLLLLISRGVEIVFVTYCGRYMYIDDTLPADFTVQAQTPTPPSWAGSISCMSPIKMLELRFLMTMLACAKNVVICHNHSN